MLFLKALTIIGFKRSVSVNLGEKNLSNLSPVSSFGRLCVTDLLAWFVVLSNRLLWFYAVSYSKTRHKHKLLCSALFRSKSCPHTTSLYDLIQHFSVSFLRRLCRNNRWLCSMKGNAAYHKTDSSAGGLTRSVSPSGGEGTRGPPPYGPPALQVCTELCRAKKDLV